MKQFELLANKKLSQQQKTSLGELKEFIQTLTLRQLDENEFMRDENKLKQLNDEILMTDEHFNWITTHIHSLAIDENTDLNQLVTLEDEEFLLSYFLLQLISCHVNQHPYDFPPYINFLLNFNLAEPFKNFTGWNLLCLSSSMQELMKQLLDKGHFLKPDTLNAIISQSPYEGCNAWFELAMIGRSILQQLWDKGIYPAAQALNSIYTQGPHAGLTAWHVFGDKEGYLLMQHLFDKGIYPSARALNSIFALGCLSGWYGLASDDKGHSLLQQLFDRGIYPKIDCLSTPIYGPSTWAYLINTPVMCTFIANNIQPPGRYLSPLLTQGYQLAKQLKKPELNNLSQWLGKMYQDSLAWLCALQIEGAFSNTVNATKGAFNDTGAALVIFWYHSGISLDNYHRALMNFAASKSTDYPRLWDRAALIFLKNERWQYLFDTLPYLTHKARFDKITLALLVKIHSLPEAQSKQPYLKAALMLSLQIEEEEIRLHCLKRIIPFLIEEKLYNFNYIVSGLVKNLITYLNQLPIAERQSYRTSLDKLFLQIEKNMIELQELQLPKKSEDDLENHITTTPDCGEAILNSFNHQPREQEEKLALHSGLKY